MTHAERIGIVGAGVVGKALAVALSKHYRVAGVASRSPGSAQECAALAGCKAYPRPVQVSRLVEILFLSTPDDAIQSVCEEIASEGGFRDGQTVVHLSGALGSYALDAARASGAKALCLHPIQTFADYREAVDSLPGSYFSLEGDDEAVALGTRLVGDLGGKPFVISSRMKPLYHAALCVASNYLVALEGLAVAILENAGVGSQEALPVLMPLIQGSVRSLRRIGLPKALTGPISRGDVNTVERQLAAMRDTTPQYLEIYRQLGAMTLEVARRKGDLTADAAEKLGVLLSADQPGS